MKIIVPVDKWNLLMAAIAGVLSFGEGGEGELVRELLPVSVNLRDLEENESPFLSMSATFDALFSMRGRIVDEVKVSAMLVTWVNIPDRDSNPFAETGYFCSKIFGCGGVAP